MRALALPLVAFLVALALAGCVSLLGAQTAEQKFYAAQGMYVIAVEEAVLYARRPDAKPEVVAVLRTADNDAHTALVAGRALLAQPSSSDRDQRLVYYAHIAQAAIGRLLEALEAETPQ